MKKVVWTSLFAAALNMPVFGALFTFDSGFQNGGAVNDGDLNGWTDTRSVSGLDREIYNVQVSLHLSGGYNGDLYAYLSHGDQTIVLLNRVGVGTAPGTDAFGYGNSGMNVTFANGGANGDIHLYGGSSVPTGTYAPDGRNVSPLATPSAFNAAGTVDFSVFNGSNPNGSWTLFVSDVVGSGGSHSTVNDWSLDISAVPEPANVALGIFAGAFGLIGCCRTERVRKLFRK